MRENFQRLCALLEFFPQHGAFPANREEGGKLSAIRLLRKLARLLRCDQATRKSRRGDGNAGATRDGSFSTDIFKRYQRSEQAFVLALMKRVVHGVSARKVSAITESCAAPASPDRR